MVFNPSYEPQWRLYIIGNGFDLYHGVASAYKDFENYVKDTNSLLYDRLRTSFDGDYLWYQFEEAFVHIDKLPVPAEPKVPVGNVDTIILKRRGLYAQFQEVDEQQAPVAAEVKQTLLKWASRLKIPACRADKLLWLNPCSRYINFNETSSLERLYHVAPENIHYLHREKESSEQYFSGLQDVREVFVLGHSLSRMDQHYFSRIASSILQHSLWVVSYHHSWNVPGHRRFLQRLGIHPDRMKFIQLKDLRKKYVQLRLFS